MTANPRFVSGNGNAKRGLVDAISFKIYFLLTPH
jgi:hypothetical protein